jgi:hypothetical protein
MTESCLRSHSIAFAKYSSGISHRPAGSPSALKYAKRQTGEPVAGEKRAVFFCFAAARACHADDRWPPLAGTMEQLTHQAVIPQIRA